MAHGAISRSSQWPPAAVVWGLSALGFCVAIPGLVAVRVCNSTNASSILSPELFYVGASNWWCIGNLLDNLAGIYFSKELVQGHAFRMGARGRAGTFIDMPLSSQRRWGSFSSFRFSVRVFGLFQHSLIIGYVLWTRNIQRLRKHFYSSQNLFWG